MASHAASVVGRLGICEPNQTFIAPWFCLETLPGQLFNLKLTSVWRVLSPIAYRRLTDAKHLRCLSLRAVELDYFACFHTANHNKGYRAMLDFFLSASSIQ